MRLPTRQNVIVPRSVALNISGQRLFNQAALAYSLLVLLLTIVQIIVPQRHGLIAITEIFAPYLFVPLVVLIPYAVLRRVNGLRLAVVLCSLVFVLRFTPTAVSIPPSATPGAAQFSAMTWNLFVSNHDTAAIVDLLHIAPTNVVALQELTTEQAAALTNDAEVQRVYPHRYLLPDGANGMGILSTFPIVEQAALHNPQNPTAFPILWARLDLGGGNTLIVVNAHPRPSLVNVSLAGLLGYDPARRDGEIAYIRAAVNGWLDRGEHVLLLGDFNTAEREPAYADLAARLQDAHMQVGLGSGNSWRPAQFKQVPLALLRIDYLWSSANIAPLSTHTDCTPRGSDHCLLRGVFELRQ